MQPHQSTHQQPKIDRDKKYVTTREKYPVRFYADDGGGTYTIHGAYLAEGEWYSYNWNKNGMGGDTAGGHPLDLIELQTILTGFVNVYQDEGLLEFGSLYDTKETCAEVAKQSNRIVVACLKVQFDPNQPEAKP